MTAKGNYTEKDAADLITQLLEGVSYLHSQGLCPLWICLQQPFIACHAELPVKTALQLGEVPHVLELWALA